MTFQEMVAEGKAERREEQKPRQYYTLRAACVAARYKTDYEQREYVAFRLPNGKFAIAERA